MRTAKHLTIPGDKAQTYEMHGNHWLALANEALEKGDAVKEEAAMLKAQYWLDMANKARGWN